MTCIVGIEHEGKVYMGGDSASVSDWDMRISTTPKVFRKQNLLIGYTWSFRMGQVIQYAHDLPELAEHPDNYAYLIESFIPFVRNAFREAGFLKIENAQEEGGQFLVGIRGEIFTIHSSFSVLRAVDGFDSIGCGFAYALGALRILKLIGEFKVDPKIIINHALETAAYFSNGVSAPFIFEEL